MPSVRHVAAASWAGAGIIPPAGKNPAHALDHLKLLSNTLHPVLSEELKAISFNRFINYLQQLQGAAVQSSNLIIHRVRGASFFFDARGLLPGVFSVFQTLCSTDKIWLLQQGNFWES